MQARKAHELRLAWGNKPCSHPDLDKEYDLGADTGDLVCTTCGLTQSRADWEAQRRDVASSKDAAPTHSASE